MVLKEHLLEKLEKYGDSHTYPLHMPGHKRQMGFIADPYKIDITEIDGFDNLHHAEGVLLEAQQRAARVYGAEESFYLVNGSTCGILSAVAAATRPGGSILMARNCHKAAYHAVLLGNLTAFYLYPKMDGIRGIYCSVTPESVECACREHPEISAVLITSPTYDGVVSDIRRIAEIVHRAGAVLIVDEAHGAHFAMHSSFPETALRCGADIVINSLHKTMPSLTQTALLHVQGPGVDRQRLKRYLGIYQSSSPSYVLMAGMDACVDWIQDEGEKAFEIFARRLFRLRSSLGQMQALHLVDGREQELYAFDYDRSKILISTEKCGITGVELMRILRERYRLELEMDAPGYVTAIMTVCDTQQGFERLERALLEIDREQRDKDAASEQASETAAGRSGLRKGKFLRVDIPENAAALTIARAENSCWEEIPLKAGAGRIAAEFVYLYPPGIPLLVPGERIPEDMPCLLEDYQAMGLKLQGMADFEGRRLRVVSNRE